MQSTNANNLHVYVYLERHVNRRDQSPITAELVALRALPERLRRFIRQVR